VLRDTPPVAPSAVGWPSTKNLVNLVPNHPRLWIGTHVKGDVDTISTTEFLTLTLILLKYRHLTEEMAPLVEKCMDHMAKFPHLSYYREYFGRELSTVHRKKAREKLVLFYFGRCEGLCSDMIWEVMQRV